MKKQRGKREEQKRQKAILVAKEFNILLIQLRTEMENNAVSYADADVNRIVVLLKGNKGFFAEQFVKEFLEYLDKLVKIIWMVPGFPTIGEGIKNSKMRFLAYGPDREREGF